MIEKGKTLQIETNTEMYQNLQKGEMLTVSTHFGSEEEDEMFKYYEQKLKAMKRKSMTNNRNDETGTPLYTQDDVIQARKKKFDVLKKHFNDGE